jgi:prepilin-type N-terminal cleavage/methylation domain-containing protein
MKQRGFTLVELIVGLSVTSVLVVLMLGVFNDSSIVWQRNDEKLDTFREARAALQVMSRDLASVAPIPKTDATRDALGNLPADVLADFPVLALQPHPDGDPDDRVNEEIYALTSTPNLGTGNLCAVGYFCVWDSKKTAFALRRQFTNSDATFAYLARALTVPITTPQVNAPALTGKAAFNALFARITDPDDPQVARQSIEDLATYIWDFRVLTPDQIDDQEATATPPPPRPWPQGVYCRELPDWVEIRFKALGGNAVRKIEGRQITRETWLDPTSQEYRRFILPGEQQFITRVRLCR